MGKAGQRGVCFSELFSRFSGWESAPAEQRCPGEPWEGAKPARIQHALWKGELGDFFFCCLFFPFQVRSRFECVSSSGAAATCSVQVSSWGLKIHFPQLTPGIFSPDAPTGPVTGYFCSSVVLRQHRASEGMAARRGMWWLRRCGRASGRGKQPWLSRFVSCC